MVSRLHALGAALLVLVAIGAAGPAASTHPKPAPASQPVRAAAPPAVNPHWVSNRCDLCHRMEAGRAATIPVTQVDRICVSCHDGVRAAAEKHPVGRPIPTRQVELPAGWPTASGRLGCLTCHNLAPTAGHARQGPRPVANPDFLRGTVSADPLTFCGQCHTRTPQHARYNPHRMVDDEGRIDNQACLFCHTRAFSAAELQRRSGKAALRADGISLCVGCHTQHIDYFEPGHIGARATPEVIARLTVLANEAQRARLPLGPAHTLVCATCHNPHEQNVFSRGSVLAIGGIAPDDAAAPVAVRLGPALCGECHGK